VRDTDTTRGWHLDHEAERRFAEFVLEHMSDAVYWIRRDGTFVRVNRAACQMLGYSPEELLAKDMFAINPQMDRERWPRMWQALIEQGSRSFESVHATRDGRTLTVDLQVNVFELDGETYSCAIARDVSRVRPIEEERRREHAFVESLVEMAPVLVVLLDGEGKVLRVNRCTELVTGVERGEAQGQSWVDTFVPEADRARVRSRLEVSLAGEPMRGGVYRVVAKSGAIRDVVWYDQLVSRADAVGMGLLCIGQDVTDQRELEQRLRQAEKMEAVGVLAGGVAHDFNNQLTGIMGWAEILKLETEGDARLGEVVDRIIVASKRARDVVTQLLAYSRKGKLIVRDVDLHAVVEEAVATLRRGLDPRIRIVLDLQAAQPRVAGDPTQLSSAVLNLGLNARDAMPEGGTLTFATRCVTSAGEQADLADEACPGRCVELTVSDTGTGMDARTQQRIFEPFFTTKGEGRGTGMGLAAVYATVKNHRGSIAVTSTPGAGTEVRLRLPGPGALAEGAASAGGRPRTGTSVAGRSMSLMLVDDEGPVREVTTRLLRRLGCQVTAFASGFDAIEYYTLAWRSIDAVILDMVMPMLDGKSTLHALRKINPKVAVVLVSGYSVEGAAQTLFDEGAAAFLQKPFTLTELAAALARLPGL